MGIDASWHHFYEIGRIFIRFHSALGGHPQKENRLVGLALISDDSVTVQLSSHPFVTRRHLPTGLMKPKFEVFPMFFFLYDTSTAQLGTPGNTRAQANFSDSFCLFEDHLRPFPGTVPSDTHFLLVYPTDPYPAFAIVHLHEISYLDATGPTVHRIQKAIDCPRHFNTTTTLRATPDHYHHYSNLILHCHARPHQHPDRLPEARWSCL